MTLLEHSPSSGQPYDELRGPDGAVRPGWSSVPDLLSLPLDELTRAQAAVTDQLADLGVTYTTNPASTVSLIDAPAVPSAVAPELAEPRQWQLDVVPFVLDHTEWRQLEAGLEQRARLFDALFADLYERRRLLQDGVLPAAAVFDHDEYLRPLVGARSGRLLLTGVDLGRDEQGRWLAMSDRTQAPSGAGYAMQNRRVLSRVLPASFHEANLLRLTPFFSAMRTALANAAPKQVEDPRVVVLSPGALSETAFDQAFLAGQLGYPLVEGSDLVVRDGRVWLRVLDKLEQVDVILRRVDSRWLDPLELFGASRLGATGMVECIRRGTVAVVNPIGSGVLENPALLPYLPALSRDLLGEDLLLESVQTWWCGEPASLSHVRANLDRLVIRSICRDGGRSIRGEALSRHQREQLLARIAARPHRFVGQERVELSTSPTISEAGLSTTNVVLRGFTVADGDGYQVMSGGLASAVHAPSRAELLVTPAEHGGSKDVWVVSREPVTAVGSTASSAVPSRERSVVADTALVPRVLDSLYWVGRYAERAEDLLRLLIAASTLDNQGEAARRAQQVVLGSLTELSRVYPGLLAEEAHPRQELRRLLVEASERGTVASSLHSLQVAAQDVRDQLSSDVWMVLATADRSRATLNRVPNPSWAQLVNAAERMLTGLLGLSGIISENMVRDPGWYLLDSGRGLERALQVLRLLEVTVCRSHGRDADRMVIDTVLSASESIVTYRRRQRGRVRVDSLIDLLVIDLDNPRSVAYQLQRVQTALLRMPDSAAVAPVRAVSELAARVHDLDPVALAGTSEGDRPQLRAVLVELQVGLRELSELIHRQWQQPPLLPQQLPAQPMSADDGRQR